MTAANDAWGLTVSTPGSVAAGGLDYDQGIVSRVVPISSGDLRRQGANVYKCISSHTATADKAPPNATYWQQYRLNRTDSGVPSPLHLAEDGSAYGPVIKLTVESHGEIYLYWGTSTQTLDTSGEKTLSILGHPPYRDQVLVVLKDFFFGRERGTPPTVAIIGGRKPVQSVITGSSAALDGDGQANPFCILAELLTHPIWGLGFSSSLLDGASWQAAADWAYGLASTLYISPLLDRQIGVRQLVSDILQGCDGWLRWNGSGVIEAGHWPHNQSAPSFDSAHTINWDDAVNGEEIEWSSDIWDGTFNKTTVKYTDSAHGYKERPATATNLWNRINRDRVADRNLERPYVTRATQALALAAQDVKVASDRTLTGPLKVRQDSTGVKVGDNFALTHDLVSQTLAVRCTEKITAAPPAGTVDLTYELERGYSAIPYQPTPSAVTGATLPRPAPVTTYAFIPVPPLLSGGTDYQLALLAGRTSELTTRLGVWMRQADGSAFYQLATLSQFATGGAVAATFGIYTDGSGNPVADNDAASIGITVDVNTPQADIDHISAVPSADAINDDALLLVVVRTSTPSQIEIMTVKSLTAVGSGRYNAVVRRAGFGTVQGGDGSSNWTTSDKGWFIFRSELLLFSHEQIPALANAGTAITFRLVPESPWYQADVADLYVADLYVADLYVAGSSNYSLTVETTYTPVDLYAPAISFVSLTKAGSAISWSTNYAPTDVFVATLTLSDTQGDMVSGSLAATIGTKSVPLALTGLAGAVTTSRTVTISGLTDGDWRLVATVTDAIGRTTTKAWPNGGSDGLLKIRTAGGGVVVPPCATPAGGNFGQPVTLSVTLSCGTGGATIEYVITPLGGTPSWPGTTYSSPVSVTTGNTLWCRAYTAGPTYSVVVSYDFAVTPRGGRQQF